MKGRIEPGRRQRNRRRTAQALWTWAIIVALFFLWQAVTYRGLAAMAAEWQFDRLGRYYPVLTLLLLAAMFGSPVLYLLRSRARPEPQAADQAGPTPTPAMSNEAEAKSARFLKLLYGAATALLACAVAIVLAMVVMLPGTGGPPATITVGSAGALQPAAGPVTLIGHVAYDRTAAFEENFLAFRRDFRFAPMMPALPEGVMPAQPEGATPPQPNGEAVRYFVELTPDGPAPSAASRHQGMLVRDALPGELLLLYQYAGFDIARPHYVLFASATSMRWPYLETAGEFAGWALLVLFAALIQRRRLVRIRRMHAA